MPYPFLIQLFGVISDLFLFYMAFILSLSFFYMIGLQSSSCLCSSSFLDILLHLPRQQEPDKFISLKVPNHSERILGSLETMQKFMTISSCYAILNDS